MLSMWDITGLFFSFFLFYACALLSVPYNCSTVVMTAFNLLLCHFSIVLCLVNESFSCKIIQPLC